MFHNLLNIPGITWENGRRRPPGSRGNECEHATTWLYITFDFKLLSIVDSLYKMCDGAGRRRQYRTKREAGKAGGKSKWQRFIGDYVCMLNIYMIILTINTLLAPSGSQRHERSKRASRRWRSKGGHLSKLCFISLIFYFHLFSMIIRLSL